MSPLPAIDALLTCPNMWLAEHGLAHLHVVCADCLEVQSCPFETPPHSSLRARMRFMAEVGRVE